MPVDYRDSAERHFKDARFLLEHKKIANADHFFGFSAECALKAVMLSSGMRLMDRDEPEKPYKVHINRLWDLFNAFMHCRSGAYYAFHLTDVRNPFMNWDVNQRYCHRTEISPEIAEAHQQGAIKAKEILDEAILNGDII